MRILKFGGTSVSSKESIQTICKIVLKQKKYRPVVIVSALTGITDMLLNLIDANASREKFILTSITLTHTKLINLLWRHTPDRLRHTQYVFRTIHELSTILKSSNKQQNEIQDKILSYGEILSSYIISSILQSHNLQTQQIIASEIIITDNNFGNANYYRVYSKNRINSCISPLITKGIIPVVTGFLGATRNGIVTTLGRGGSDYTASIIGSCLNVDEIQIWTDVDGIYTADPRIVSGAKILHRISYQQAEKFARSGAKVVCSKTIYPARDKNIPLRIKNTFNLKSRGTLIQNQEPTNKNLRTGVTYYKLFRDTYVLSFIGTNLDTDRLYDQLHKVIKKYKGMSIKKYSRSSNMHISFSFRTNNIHDILNDAHTQFILNYL